MHQHGRRLQADEGGAPPDAASAVLAHTAAAGGGGGSGGGGGGGGDSAQLFPHQWRTLAWMRALEARAAALGGSRSSEPRTLPTLPARIAIVSIIIISSSSNNNNSTTTATTTTIIIIIIIKSGQSGARGSHLPKLTPGSGGHRPAGKP